MLITDIRLGAYNGLQLVVRARLANPSLPVLVVTAFHDPVLQEETERLNAIYMRKPVDAAQVLAAIARAFGSAQSQPSVQSRACRNLAMRSRLKGAHEH